MSALLLILFFSGRWIGRISLEKKKKTPYGRHSMRRLVHELHRVEKSSPSSFVKLMRAWPIRCLNIFISGPARIVTDNEQQQIR